MVERLYQTVMHNWGLHSPDGKLQNTFNAKSKAVTAARSAPADWYATNEKSGEVVFTSTGTPRAKRFL